MTVVAAIAREGRVVMAADTCTGYQGTEITGARKIERVRVGDDEALLACSGSASLLAVAVRHWSADAPSPAATEDDVRDWANAIASALTEIAAAQNPPILTDGQNGGPATIDGAFLLGWRGRLFYLFTHVAFEVEDGLAALGIGTDLAFGAMTVSLDAGHPTEIAARTAVQLACQRYEGCRVGPSGPVVEHLGELAGGEYAAAYA